MTKKKLGLTEKMFERIKFENQRKNGHVDGARIECDLFILLNYWQYGIEGLKEIYSVEMFEGIKEGGLIVVVFLDAAQDWLASYGRWQALKYRSRGRSCISF